MKQLINEWRKYLIEQDQGNDRFKRNLNIIDIAYHNSPYGYLTKEFTPENAKILTEIDLEDSQKGIMGGVYGKVFPIKDSDRMLKLFAGGVDVYQDVQRMKRVTDQVFKGEASAGEMHYFEFGTLGNASEDLGGKFFKYVIMPRIIPFERSITYKEEPNLFNALSPAIQQAAKSSSRNISYTDFFEKVMDNFTDSLKMFITSYVPDADKQKQVDEFAERTEEFQDTISKLIQIAYKTLKKENGRDLHLGNLGFFPQKPDEWFYFDM